MSWRGPGVQLEGLNTCSSDEEDDIIVLSH